MNDIDQGIFAVRHWHYDTVTLHVAGASSVNGEETKLVCELCVTGSTRGKMEPKVRQDLVVSEIEGEIVVYDPLTREAHHLNLPLAKVFRLCDGQTAMTDILCVPEYALAMGTLRDAGLLEEPVSGVEKIDRRSLLATLGKSTLLPAILSIGVPRAAAAVSGITETQCFGGGAAVCGQPCTDVIGTRICAAVAGSGDNRCGCVAVGAAAACSPSPCDPFP